MRKQKQQKRLKPKNRTLDGGATRAAITPHSKHHTDPTEMIMRDQLSETTTLMVTLSTAELYQAARLGGLPFAFEERDLDDAALSLELISHFAKRGISESIQQSFEHGYPSHYPEDFDNDDAGDAALLRPCELKRRAG